MPEATILYSVTGVVIAGLVVWVVLALNTAKEPWARPAPALVEGAAVEEESAALVTPEAKVETVEKSDADETARQTPVALSTGRAKAASLADKVEEASTADAGAKKSDA